MGDFLNLDNGFLDQLNRKIEENFAREEFGVSELAEAMNMSRSNLLRKVKKATNLSVSQLINQTRLQRGMELLRTTSLNVSEVSHQVGFNSTSYFIKCFREHFGYPPGEVGKRPLEEAFTPIPEPDKETEKRSPALLISLAVLLLALAGLATWLWPAAGEKPIESEKSILVLPFKNDSSDSSNVYLINGLMEATLNNLQKIKNLRVLSRTSAEKYRNSSKSIPEIAEELNVNYLVEGSGQKMGDKIVLNIQLVDGSTDRHLWSKQYRREAGDIFTLQQEISKDIVAEIQVFISPEEKQRIEKIPTNNPEAYDLFLQGVGLLISGNDTNLEKSLEYFQQAIDLDPTFAHAYACSAMAYYFLDYFRTDKQYLDELGSSSDKAILYDPKLGESLTAKAMYYMHKKEYTEALPYLEKGLEYNPNSTQILGLLADYYNNYMPNTGKYLEYALKGLRLDAGSEDSVSASYFYLRLGNALVQAGFVDKSLEYLDKSLEVNPANLFSHYVRAFVLHAHDKDLRKTRELLKVEFEKDTNRFDILQDLGKVSYYLREYEDAYQYYERFIRLRERLGLDVYTHEHMIIGIVYDKVGQEQKGKEFIESYREFFKDNQTVYRDLALGMYHFYKGEEAKGMDYLRQFSKEDNIQFWVILFLPMDPILDNIKGNPEFKEIMDEIESRFWRNNQKIREKLEEEGIW
ncbi:helix-turn-helix domain-containing protein [Pararhodonellum marinum]|uniref:helix-turn-helix domain-containing protein n=1 Tax=Pararhodonellum marinum TaxID=2755358 RepID=UPI00188E6FAD|nr:helix-turn-helix domain-containing protein [Pararhodonellum marinum]